MDARLLIGPFLLSTGLAVGSQPMAARFEVPENAASVDREHSDQSVTHYRFRNVDGVRVFYREAGPADGPAIVLLHGYPASSYMFRNVISAFAERYHVVAPDYPGWPARPAGKIAKA